MKISIVLDGKPATATLVEATRGFRYKGSLRGACTVNPFTCSRDGSETPYLLLLEDVEGGFIELTDLDGEVIDFMPASGKGTRDWRRTHTNGRIYMVTPRQDVSCGFSLALDVEVSVSAYVETTLCSLRAKEDERAVQTTYGETFSGNDHADLAWLVYRRFGRDMEAGAVAWRRLLQNSCSTDQFMELVSRGQDRSVK